MQAERIGLGHLARGVDLVVEHHERTEATRGGIGRHAEALEQVGGALVPDRARVPHGPDHDDRPIVSYREVQEVRDLLERVGTAGHHDAGQVLLLVEQRVDPAGERKPLVQRELGARDVGELLALGPRVGGDLWNGGQQFFVREPCASAVGDRSTRRDEPHSRESYGGRAFGDGCGLCRGRLTRSGTAEAGPCMSKRGEAWFPVRGGSRAGSRVRRSGAEEQTESESDEQALAGGNWNPAVHHCVAALGSGSTRESQAERPSRAASADVP